MMSLDNLKVGLAAIILAGCSSWTLDFSGSWNLNIARSDWGEARKPLRVVVEIEHREPAFKYSGTVFYPDGELRSFGFDGLIDGKSYRAWRSFGEGKMSMRHSDERSLLSVFLSEDGRYREETTTTLTENGRILKRRIKVTGPGGETAWDEVYERQ
ncbi:MAG: hypothetical protein AB1898_24300 [Acidobacteriota bacterium]